jgi:dephospho-CoA kinase
MFENIFILVLLSVAALLLIRQFVRMSRGQGGCGSCGGGCGAIGTIRCEARPMTVLGVTGSVGAGKTTLCNLLAGHGGVLINADQVGHQVFQQPDVSDAVCEEFGPSVKDDSDGIDRTALGRLVFSDPDARARLEAIVHPPMRLAFEQQIAGARQTGATRVILDAAVLFEAGWDDLCTATVFVDAPRDVREARVMVSRNWSCEELSLREKAQFPLDKKSESCTFNVRNGQSKEELAHQAETLLVRLDPSPSV